MATRRQSEGKELEGIFGPLPKYSDGPSDGDQLYDSRWDAK